MLKQDEITPEISFLFSYSRTKINPGGLPFLQKLSVIPLDWEHVFTLACRHRVASLIYLNLNTHSEIKKFVPEHIFIKFKDYYYSVLAKNMALQRDFLLIHDALKGQYIETLPLKGIILGETIYHNPALRPIYSDIDLLVREKDIAASAAVLQNMGFEALTSGAEHIRNFRKKGLLIELHWLLLPPQLNRFDMRRLWENSKEYLIDEKRIRALSLEDTLLSLPLQIRHDWPYFELFRLCDINEIITRHGAILDWDYILKAAKEYQVAGTLLFNLCLCQKLFSSELPNNILNKLADCSIKNNLLRFGLKLKINRIFDHNLRFKQGELRKYLFKLLLIDDPAKYLIRISAGSIMDYCGMKRCEYLTYPS